MDDRKKADLLSNIASREAEVYGYQLNINNYTELLKILPSKYPANLEGYSNMTSEQIVENVCEADMQLVSDLNFRDKIAKTLKIEKLEQSKAIHVLNALKSQLEI